MIVLDVRITEKEFVKLNLQRSLRKPVIAVCIMAVVLSLSTVFNGVTGPGSVFNMWYWFIPYAVLVYIIAVISFFNIRRHKKYYQELSFLHESLNYEITGNGIRIKGETFEYHEEWTTFKSLNIYKNWIGLIKIGTAGYYIPGKYLTKNELAALVTLAKKQGIRVNGKLPA